LSQKVYFCKDKFILQGIISAKFLFCALEKKLCLIQGKKKDFSISKLGSQCLKRPPSKSMEVIAPAFFDLRSSRGPQRLLESAI
jgi:hypothetical protein